MGWFTEANARTAAEIIARYPRPRSAVIPLLHLAQEQEGWITRDAMREIAELTGTTPAEVLGTGSFYEMFKFHPVGSYVVNVCTNISCQLLGGEELLHHVEESLGFTVNYRYFHRATTETFDAVVDDLRNGRSPLARGGQGDDGHLPVHGTLGRVRQHVPDDRRAGVVPPEEADGAPVWLRTGLPADGDSDA